MASQHEQQLAEALAVCRAAPAGERAATVARFPQFATELAEYLDAEAHFDRLAEPLKAAVRALDDAPTIGWHPGPTGELLRSFADYELLQEIGRGGMGVVYKARQKALDRLVALKMIRADDLGSEAEVRRFQNEAETVARLDHPHIVPIYDVGQEDGRHFFSMKLIDGDSLSRIVGSGQWAVGREEGQRRVAGVMVKVARAVHYAHQHGILHRDLKPANVLLDKDGEPFVTDFGLAKHLSAADAGLTDSGMLVGTPSYMAPEQAACKKQVLTTAADVYGLGGILYALLTGRPPFEGETAVDTLMQVLEHEPVRPGVLNPAVDRDLETICLKCLHKEPAQRFASAEALAADLQRWLDGVPIRARPVGRVERLARWCRRNPLPAAGLALAALAWISLTAAAVLVARAREASLRAEVLQSSVYAAHGVASTVLLQLQQLAGAVERAADDAELRKKLVAGDRAGLQARVETIRRRHDRAGAGPFHNWYVLDKDGIQLVDLPRNPATIGQSFRGRDYFRGALVHVHETGRAALHVSRVYRSKNDQLYKVGLSAPVRTSDRADAPLLGVVVATMTTDSTMGLAGLHDQRRKAVLIGPLDTNPADREPGPELGHEERVILIHPAYHRGDTALGVPEGRVPVFAAGPGGELEQPASAYAQGEEDYTDPVGAVDPHYAGRWLAGFAPVGNTEFLVGVQERFDEVVGRDQLLTLWGGLTLSLGGVLAGIAAWLGVRRRLRTGQ
jgi:serine/threonine-protein kinase